MSLSSPGFFVPVLFLRMTLLRCEKMKFQLSVEGMSQVSGQSGLITARDPPQHQPCGSISYAREWCVRCVCACVFGVWFMWYMCVGVVCVMLWVWCRLHVFTCSSSIKAMCQVG